MHRHSALRPYTPPEPLPGIFRSGFERTWEQRGLFLTTMHPRVIGDRSRIFILEEPIDPIRSRRGV